MKPYICCGYLDNSETADGCAVVILANDHEEAKIRARAIAEKTSYDAFIIEFVRPMMEDEGFILAENRIHIYRR